MTEERPTIRPVTLGRLVELTHACEANGQTTSDLEAQLEMTHRRARETVLEALRIDLLHEGTADDKAVYSTTEVGKEFLDAVRDKAWDHASTILAAHSPHYDAFLEAVAEIGPADLDILLRRLEETAETSPYEYNQTSVEVTGDWAERLGEVQRNAFTGSYYVVQRDDVPEGFPTELLEIYDDLEETAGVNLRQRYLSIPRLREAMCEHLGCTREAFDDALVKLCQQNVGKLELSGAPLDTAAKDAILGIKQIDLANDRTIVSTSQSTQRVMSGIEQFDKQYYYLAVYDRDITFTQETKA